MDRQPGRQVNRLQIVETLAGLRTIRRELKAVLDKPTQKGQRPENGGLSGRIGSKQSDDLRRAFAGTYACVPKAARYVRNILRDPQIERLGLPHRIEVLDFYA